MTQEIVTFFYTKPNVSEICNVRVNEPDVEVFPDCICKLDIGGGMIYCENKACRRGNWFHYECVGIVEEDIDPDSKWFCCKQCEKVAQKKVGKGKRAADFNDHKLEYLKCLLWSGLGEMARYDAIKENDGQRMIMHWKYDMINFYEHNHPKYIIYGVRLLCNVSGAASARLRHQLMYNRTVNMTGGAGKNVEKDLHCEHLNNRYKGESLVHVC